MGLRVIRTGHRGLSSARNTGLAAATGEIVAYIDDDAFPHHHWLTYLVLSINQNEYVAVGGPNIPPPDHGLVADAVAVAPGGPAHVMVTDREAEHLPGCNLAIRREALEAIGGFDTRFRSAGDDVDVCWRLQEAGGRLGFSPAAVVWHHRRDTVRGYWRQQVGYGRAEAMLAAKWPEKYNQIGQATWLGRLYGAATAVPLLPFQSARVHFGRWGGAAFQPAHQPAASLFDVLPLTSNWYALVLMLLVGTALSLVWPPLAITAGSLALVMTGLTLTQAARLARHGLRERGAAGTGRRRFGLSTALVVLQPLARLYGRTSRRDVRFGRSGWALPHARSQEWTSTQWAPLERRLSDVDARACQSGARVQVGTPGDRWDLQVDGGLLGAARLRTTVEEHGHGVQVIRARTWPRLHSGVLTLAALLLVASLAAALGGTWLGAATFLLTGALLIGLAAREAGHAQAVVLHSVAAFADVVGAEPASAQEPLDYAVLDGAALRFVPNAGIGRGFGEAARSLAAPDAAMVGLTTSSHNGAGLNGVKHNGVTRNGHGHNGIGQPVRPRRAPLPLRSGAPLPPTPSTPDE
jgi:hypothetical protein